MRSKSLYNGKQKEKERDSLGSALAGETLRGNRKGKGLYYHKRAVGSFYVEQILIPTGYLFIVHIYTMLLLFYPVSQPWRSSLLDVCMASGLLLVHALLVSPGDPIVQTSPSLSTSSSPSMSPSTPLSSVPTYGAFSVSLAALWDKMICTVKCETTESILRKKALTVCLEILKSLLDGMAKKESRMVIFNSKERLCVLTARFLDDYSSLDTPPSVLLVADVVEPISSNTASTLHNKAIEDKVADDDAAAVNVWLLSCQQSAISNSLSHSFQTGNIVDFHNRSPNIVKKKTSTTSSGHVDTSLAETRAKCHILLILPAITTLVCIPGVVDNNGRSGGNNGTTIVREAACRAIARINMSALVESLSGLEETNRHMATEISRLQIEVNSISSNAASLPF